MAFTTWTASEDRGRVSNRPSLPQRLEICPTSLRSRQDTSWPLIAGRILPPSAKSRMDRKPVQPNHANLFPDSALPGTGCRPVTNGATMPAASLAVRSGPEGACADSTRETKTGSRFPVATKRLCAGTGIFRPQEGRSILLHGIAEPLPHPVARLVRAARRGGRKSTQRR
jgi:hypothetical protein